MTYRRTLTYLLACSLGATSIAHAQNLWSRLPALPTTCYRNDEFYSQIDVVGQQAATLATEQLKTNDALDRQAQSLDAGTKQARLMAFMQKDPMNGAKFMQEAATTAQQASDMQNEIDAKRKALKERFETLQAQYKADFAKTDPAWDRYAKAMENANTLAKANEYAAIFNAAYEREVCQKWWKSTSPFLPYLADLKNLALEKTIPVGELGARTKRQNLDMMGIPSAAYKSTAEAEAVKEYVEAAQKVFQLRYPGPVHYP